MVSKRSNKKGKSVKSMQNPTHTAVLSVPSVPFPKKEKEKGNTLNHPLAAAGTNLHTEQGRGK